MYKKTAGQLRMEDAVFLHKSIKLSKSNRWVQIAHLIPWEKYEDQYGSLFASNKGGPYAHSIRTGLGALLIKTKLNLSDAETVLMISENPAMQYLVDVDIAYGEQPFCPSMMTYFRERLGDQIINQVNEDLVVEMVKLAHEEIENSEGQEESEEDEDDPSKCDPKEKHRGDLVIDATCAPADIHYPTDFHLLNSGREISEQIIDILHAPDVGIKRIPRTYRDKARDDYLSVEKLRRKAYDQLREAIKKQLSYLKRNIGYIENYKTNHPDRFDKLPKTLKEKYATIQTLYEQQQFMYDEKTHSIKDRIVSIHQPYVRPIVRGKSGTPVEFGIKMNTSIVEGFVFIDYMSFDNFNEGGYLKASVELYRERFGYYPKTVIADTIYRTRKNRRWLAKLGIRISGPALGRKPKNKDKIKERREMEKRDAAIRNQVEGCYGVAKRKYGLDRVREKTDHTFRTKVALAFLVMNIDKMLRAFCALFLNFRIIPHLAPQVLSRLDVDSLEKQVA